MTDTATEPETTIDRAAHLEHVLRQAIHIVDHWKESPYPAISVHQQALIRAVDDFLEATKEPVYLVEWGDSSFGTTPMTLEEVRNEAGLFGEGVKRLNLWDKHEGIKETYTGLVLSRMMNPEVPV